MICNSDDTINFPHEILLTNRQVVNILQIFYQMILIYQKLNDLR